MNRRFKHGALIAAVVGSLGIVGAGCLTRPVEHADPLTKTNFTSVVHNQTVDKLDLLFMIDNSASMGDKQALLALAVPDMITRLVSPFCVDANGNLTATHVAADGITCPAGQTAEFTAVHDMHIGIVSSSLGGRGGDQCDPTATNPANGSLNAHNDDKGELINRGSNNDPTSETPVPDINTSNFLSWFPSVAANQGKQPTLPPAIGASAQLNADFGAAVSGVHEHGCGFEAQNEAWYRFLSQPDPFASITKNGTHASLNGIDNTILQQRHDFLRPDSLLAIIVVTDENEEAADPLAIGGQGWAFDNGSFPGSPNGAAPQGTIECLNQDPNNPLKTGPNDPNCTSCAFIQGDPNFATRCPKDGQAGANGYLDPADDNLNVRFFNQKLRFGLFAGYPISRYTRAMQKTTVPDSAHEHDKAGNYVGDQDQNANCVNPIYAQDLPTDPTKDLCGLTRGPRTPDLVYYAAIAGVPHQLLQQDPTNPDSPQKDTLADADWVKITGNDPEHYDFSGIDFHMLESEAPRTTQGVMSNASTCPPGSPDTCDKINGREWDTKKGDLQFACIFDLRPQFQGTGKDCTQQKYSGACDCAANALNSQTQLCQGSAGAYTTTQINGKAYPSVREMVIAHKMGAQGIVSSLCPIHVTDNGSGNDPLFGYRPAVNAIVNRLKASLSNQCLPQTLQADSCGVAPCLILVTLGTQNGPGSCRNPGAACDPTQGLVGPGSSPLYPQDVWNKFCDAQEAAYKATGASGNDPDLSPVCALQQLTQLPPNANASNCAPSPASDFDSVGSCAGSKDPGWCYVTGAAAKGCPQAILFTTGEPPHGSTVNLQCIETSVNVVGDGGGGG